MGAFEQLVLLAVLRLGERAYGVAVVEEIAARTGRDPSRAAVYIALRRLAEKGLVRSELSAPTPQRGGRAKRYYRVEPRGIDELAQARRDLLEMWKGVRPLLEQR